jgi:maltose O-acetyltransferase
VSRSRHGIFVLLELLLRITVVPALRARLLGVLGASVGRNVRVNDCRLINLSKGFSNLTLADDVHVGNGCLIDLEGPVSIGRGTVLAPRVVVLSHNDPGAHHGSPLARRFGCDARGVTIGAHCWIGANATLLSGTTMGDRCVLGAMSLAKDTLLADRVYAGIPARVIDAAPRQECE